VLDLARFDRVERATGGFDTTVWHLERGKRAYALRVFRADQAHVLHREVVALEAAAAGGVPVPRLEAIGTHEQRPALLQEWSHGRTLLEAVRARPADVLRFSYRFGQLQARLHQVPAPPGLRSNWLDWAGPCEPSLRPLLLQASATEPARLIHLDCHPLNVLVDAGGRPTALLDWTNAHGGDRRADIARTLTILRLSPPLGGPAQRVSRLLIESGWRLGYGSFGPDMSLFYAWAGQTMLYDLAKRHSPAELAHVSRWTQARRHRAGV
jgi:aminoglycoside phosphotransferase (APT) family kinase protein